MTIKYPKVGYPANGVIDRIFNGEDELPSQPNRLALDQGVGEAFDHGDLDATIRSLKRYDDILAAWIDQVLGTISTTNPDWELEVRQIINFIVSSNDSWPHISVVLSKYKNVIVRYFIYKIKDASNATSWKSIKLSNIRNMIKAMVEAGYNWPELQALLVPLGTALKESADLNKGRQMVIKFMTDTFNESSRGAWYVLHHANDLNLNMDEWPEIKALLDQNKKEFIAELIKYSKSKDLHGALYFARKLKKINVGWPEIDVIIARLEAAGAVLEEASQDDLDDMLRQMESDPYLHRDLIYDQIRKFREQGISKQRILEHFESYKLNILGWLEKRLQSLTSGSQLILLINEITELLKLGANWPELAKLINDNKTTVMKFLLLFIKQNSQSEILGMARNYIQQRMINILKLDWPELPVIIHTLRDYK